MFGELPDRNDRDPCTVTFPWLKSRVVGSVVELDFLAVSDPSALRFRRHRVAIGLQVSPHIRQEEALIAGSKEAARFDALQGGERITGPSDARSSHLYTLGPSSGTRLTGWSRSLEGFRIVLTWLPTSTFCMRRTDEGVTSGFRRRISAGMSTDPNPITDFLQWWIIVARRYLVPADHFHRLPLDEISVEATQRQSGPHPARPDVSHVPDNKRSRRRMMVGTGTIARDWQWLDEMMAEDAPAMRPTQKFRRMPERYARRRGAGRAGRRGRSGRGREEGMIRRPPSRLKVVSAPFKRPDTQFDGSQVRLDLNEPVSGPSHVFMALGGTPPSAAHVPGGSWEVPFMEPTRLPTPPTSPAPAEQPYVGLLRKDPRRRGCGTGGHM
ncbi:hypothetical protein PIB30_047167 [Stylosanthes scabra]|uniref:Aminotransferase-like plant mobile domain-containing protein n=1 Tax=Stylosanthes scabra TaxID=79078 RepID=A0ABU6ZFF1_9FABA|nr:hypothetical protein [Stylosanthes scabra]